MKFLKNCPPDEKRLQASYHKLKKLQNFYKSRFFLKRETASESSCSWLYTLILFSSAPVLSHANTHKSRLADEKIKEIKCRIWFPAGQLLLLLKTGRISARLTKNNS